MIFFLMWICMYLFRKNMLQTKYIMIICLYLIYPSPLLPPNSGKKWVALPDFDALLRGDVRGFNIATVAGVATRQVFPIQNLQLD